MNTSYQRPRDKTSVIPTVAVKLAISQIYIIYYKISIIRYANETEFPNEYHLNNYLLHLREATLYRLIIRLLKRA
ncbi:hypothetical protein V1477_021198 [Vespula maculifrons]|uniref:Uncharacterized protein n=1 Tax=Vespula maculifrons TaxID=7453 RepID=A0ABD2AGG0_VESMC